MIVKLIIHTLVNDVIYGAIRNVSLIVKNADGDALSATVGLGETTVVCVHSIRVQAKDENLIMNALGVVAEELHSHGVESLKLDAVNSDLHVEIATKAFS